MKLEIAFFKVFQIIFHNFLKMESARSANYGSWPIFGLNVAGFSSNYNTYKVTKSL